VDFLETSGDRPSAAGTIAHKIENAPSTKGARKGALRHFVQSETPQVESAMRFQPPRLKPRTSKADELLAWVYLSKARIAD
jgi:hypothetical protein